MKNFVIDNNLNTSILKNEIHTFLKDLTIIDNTKIEIGICNNPNQAIALYTKQSKKVVKQIIWIFENERECKNAFNALVKEHSKINHNKEEIFGKYIYVVVLG